MNFVVSHDSLREIRIFCWVSIFSTIKFDWKFKLLINKFLQFSMFKFQLFFSTLSLLFDFLFRKHMIKSLFDIGWWNLCFWSFTESKKSQIGQWFHQHLTIFISGYKRLINFSNQLFIKFWFFNKSEINRFLAKT